MIEKQDLEFQYDINIDVKLLIFKKIMNLTDF